MRGRLLIGAFRDHEVDAAHPLRRLLCQPTSMGAPVPVPVLTLASLTAGDVTELLADMLHRPPDGVSPLAAALYAKTSGNPFCTIAYLQALHREDALRADPQRGRWHWDLAAIAAHPASANVVDFLATGLRELAPPTADALVAAACLGNACTLGFLALATGKDPGALADRLGPALERGILVTPNALAIHQADRGAALAFCHDRMQQAVYQLRADAWRGRLHLAMARRLAQAGAAPGHSLRAAEHYALAAPLIVETAERVRARAPMNFGHLYDLVEAERFDALDQPWDALQTFERALRRAGAQRRPWHQALITQRAGYCYLRRGLEDAGRALLAHAHALYRHWGALGKARAMRDAWPFLDASQPGEPLGRMTADEAAQRGIVAATGLPLSLSRTFM
ncbi:hypothetical protein [uncultured Thiodictyon sp.]|uniref:hypothetical protein n=1 Tax=uncultured Thiodictyon sp. TaxID=1846217 RepID=UPI0025D72B93|nr:hypothetical protein [uncultured Thiodictyon sp.]